MTLVTMDYWRQRKRFPKAGIFIYREFPVTASITILGAAELRFPGHTSVYIQIVDEFRGIILQDCPAVFQNQQKKKRS
jgi:hypothetical protein